MPTFEVCDSQTPYLDKWFDILARVNIKDFAFLICITANIQQLWIFHIHVFWREMSFAHYPERLKQKYHSRAHLNSDLVFRASNKHYETTAWIKAPATMQLL